MGKPNGGSCRIIAATLAKIADSVNVLAVHRMLLPGHVPGGGKRDTLTPGSPLT